MNAWGAMLAPYMLMCGLTMLQDRHRPVHWLPLMTLMTIIIQIHLLSSVFFVVTLVPFFIIGLIRTDQRWGMIKETALAVIGTTILTANVWGALLMLNLHNNIATPGLRYVQELAGAVPVQQYSGLPDLLLLAAFPAPVCLRLLSSQTFSGQHNRHDHGAIVLIFSSIWTPWEKLAVAIPSLQHNLQFPNRLTVIAYPLLLLGVAIPPPPSFSMTMNRPSTCGARHDRYSGLRRHPGLRS
ncbi:MAG: hypothetical protein ACLSH6_06855 [Limosilactobacillus pontis]